MYKKVISIIKILHFQVCIFQDQPWNLPDFMDEIHWISWNPLNFMHEICLISNLLNFMHEIHWISWNLPDFMKSTRFRRISCQMSQGPCLPSRTGRAHTRLNISEAASHPVTQRSEPALPQYNPSFVHSPLILYPTSRDNKGWTDSTQQHNNKHLIYLYRDMLAAVNQLFK